MFKFALSPLSSYFGILKHLLLLRLWGPWVCIKRNCSTGFQRRQTLGVDVGSVRKFQACLIHRCVSVWSHYVTCGDTLWVQDTPKVQESLLTILKSANKPTVGKQKGNWAVTAADAGLGEVTANETAAGSWVKKITGRIKLKRDPIWQKSPAKAYSQRSLAWQVNICRHDTTPEYNDTEELIWRSSESMGPNNLSFPNYIRGVGTLWEKCLQTTVRTSVKKNKHVSVIKPVLRSHTKYHPVASLSPRWLVFTHQYCPAYGSTQRPWKQSMS